MLEVLKEIEMLVFVSSGYVNAFEIIMFKLGIIEGGMDYYYREESYYGIVQLNKLHLLFYSAIDHTGDLLVGYVILLIIEGLFQRPLEMAMIFLTGAIIGDTFLLLIGLTIKKYIKIKSYILNFINKYILILGVFLRIVPMFGIFSTIFIGLSNKSLKEKFLYIIMGNIFILIYYFIFYNYLYVDFLSIHYLVFMVFIFLTLLVMFCIKKFK